MRTRAVYIPRKGDEEVISERLSNYEKLHHDGLIDIYLDVIHHGINPTHYHLLCLLALRIAFLRLFETSPVGFKDNHIITIQLPPFSIQRRQ